MPVTVRELGVIVGFNIDLPLRTRVKTWLSFGKKILDEVCQ